MLRRLVALSAGFVVLVGCGGEAAPAGESRPPAPVVQGFDSADLTALQSRWWSWAASTPPEANPVSDTTGAHCASDQPRDVWFVAGSFGDTVERRCQVPAGRPLAGPAVNRVSPDRAGCAEFMADAKGEVTLDGTPIAVASVGAEMTFQAKPGNAVTGRGGEFDVHGCGLWFTVPPLPPGEHLLVIQGSSGTFSVKATYHLTVSADD